MLDVDTIVICAGQEPRRELFEPLRQAGRPVTLIGGADVAVELDARRAIAQGTEVALGLLVVERSGCGIEPWQPARM